jgi:hypothetical protein
MAETPESSLGGTKRKRRIPPPVAFVLRIAVVVLVAVIVAAFGYRYYLLSQFEAKRDALLQESQRAHELLGNPTDWEAWVSARMPANHGGAEFVQLIEKYRVLHSGLSSAERNALCRWLDEKNLRSVRFPNPNSLMGDPAARAVAQRLLDESPELPHELEQLLRFDSLSPGPDLHYALWDFALSGFFELAFVAEVRVLTLYDMGLPEKAAEEALIYLQIAQRLNAPASSREASLQSCMEEESLRFLIELVAQGRLRESGLATLASLRPPDTEATIARLIEWDVASAAQGWAHWQRGTLTMGEEGMPYAGPVPFVPLWEQLACTYNFRYVLSGQMSWCESLTDQCKRRCERLADLRAGKRPVLTTDDYDEIGDAAGWATLRVLVWERLLAITGLRLGEDPAALMQRYPSVSIETRGNEWVLSPVQYSMEQSQLYDAMLLPPSHLNGRVRVKR